MSIKRENICRLCLNVVTNEFAEIDEVIRQMFDILPLELDLKITRNPIICWDCIEIAKRCLQFKLTCLATERIILFSIGRDIAKHSIKVIYKEREKVKTILNDDLHVCRICMTRLEGNKFTSLGTMRNELTMFNMLARYMSEMDVNIIEDPIICTTCTENLYSYFKFVMNCLNTEGKITSYCKEVGKENMGQINLDNIFNFSSKHCLERAEICSQICTIKGETHLFEEPKCVYLETYNDLIKLEELEIKEEVYLEESYYKNQPEMGLDKSTKLVTSSKTKEGIIEKGTYQKKVQAIIMKDCTSHEDTLKVDKSENSNFQINKCEMVTNVKKNIRRDLITDIAFSDKSGKKMYKCFLCGRETKDKSSLTRHMLVHKNVSEMDMHKCSVCVYKTKYKHNLKNHMLVHQDISEIKMYKCFLCGHETKDKSSLPKHMLVHKDVSDINMHKCSMCTYETKHKSDLRMHMLVHKDVSEIDMHKCSLCTYETKYKSKLKSHMSVHLNISEKSMHKCSTCAYKTKLERNLKKHMLVHQDISEIKMCKCFLCGHETKNKSSLTKHMLIHKEVSEINMHKCSMCTHETKHKSNLKRHMLVHKDVSKTNMHRCSMCSYETKRKSNLESHIFVHKDVSEINMHKCSMCTFETKHKRNLKRHIMLVHHTKC